MTQDRLDAFMSRIINATRSITKIKNHGMSDFGLGSTHTMCMRKLYEEPKGLTRTQLAQRCELDKAQISRIVNELVDNGCVSIGDENSNYKRRVFLTEAGREAAKKINDMVLDVNNFVSGDISEEDIETFYKVFDEICENLKKAEKRFDSERKDLNYGSNQ